MSIKQAFLVFPGQGSQYRGMGSDLVKEFPAAREIFERASAVVGYDMSELCFSDPRAELDRTRFTQPALLTQQIACFEAFSSLLGGDLHARLAAGHSLGEYSALVCAGALSFESALLLVVERGRLMSEFGRGSMLATTLDPATAKQFADKHYCGIGGCNLPEQTVVAGQDSDLEALTEDLKAAHPRKRAMRLNTEGAFHTYWMVHAAQEFRPVLEAADFGSLRIGVLSNYTGSLHENDPDAIRSRLFFQLFNPVLWVDCMNSAIDAGIDAVVEFGGGIGKAEGPEDKRPNLENIVKKSLNSREYEAQYAAAINVAGIRAAAEQFADKE